MVAKQKLGGDVIRGLVGEQRGGAGRRAYLLRFALDVHGGCVEYFPKGRYPDGT